MALSVVLSLGFSSMNIKRMQISWNKQNLLFFYDNRHFVILKDSDFITVEPICCCFEHEILVFFLRDILYQQLNGSGPPLLYF